MRVLVESGKRMSDDLVAQSTAGDLDARADLIDICLPHIWRTVTLICGEYFEVEDLVQASALHMLEKLPSYRGPNRFLAWLERLTINLVHQNTRKRLLWLGRRTEMDMDDMPTSIVSGPDIKTGKRILFQRLTRHLDCVRPKNRKAVVLSMFFGYSAAEIGQIVGCSQEAAWKRINRGQSDLVRRLRCDKGFKSSLKGLL